MEQQTHNANNPERTYTQTEMEAIIRSVIEQVDTEKEERNTESAIPMEILEELENTSTQQLQDNFKRFKRDTRKYILDDWTTPERINKSVLPYLKKHSTETTQVVSTFYKITENTRFQARVLIEIFEQLRYILQNLTEPQQLENIISKCAERSKRLAIFQLATAKAQEREAKEYANKALHLPISIQHLETVEDDYKIKNAYSTEFLTSFHQANFQQELVQQRGGNYHRGRGNGFYERGNYRGRFDKSGRRGGSRGGHQQSFFGSGPQNKWGNANNNFTNSNNNSNSNPSNNSSTSNQ